MLVLSACGQPLAQQSREREADVAIDGTRFNKGADRDVSRWEDYERANDAKTRFRVAKEQARVERSRAASDAR